MAGEARDGGKSRQEGLAWPGLPLDPWGSGERPPARRATAASLGLALAVQMLKSLRKALLSKTGKGN